MTKDAVMLADKKEMPGRVSVALPPEIYSEINARAEQHDMSLNRTILQLLRAGLEAERQKKQRLEEMLREYRECTDPQQAERLGGELGAMIFGEAKIAGTTSPEPFSAISASASSPEK